jgi:AcrR family transcriptional regulator
MHAKSDNLRATAPKKQTKRRHLPYEERRALLLDKAIDFFSEYGLTGQTRHLAAACDVSQRLLYRYFPNKSALLDEVYREAIAKPFDEAWLDEFREPNAPLRDRLIAFYTHYADKVLTRRWLRLYLYSSLGDNPMARVYGDTVVRQILDVIIETAARDLALTLPKQAAERRRLAAGLHGAVVQAGLQVHVYGITTEPQWRRDMIQFIDAFLIALPGMCARSAEAPVRVDAIAVANRRTALHDAQDNA